MGVLLLAAFIGVPLIEIAVFIQVGGAIGLGWTLLVVVATALAGTWLLRAQGLATLQRARRQVEAGQLPARELFDGVCLLFAGALLLTPGFVTDGLGLLLFMPPFRDLLRRAFLAHLARAGKSGPGGARVWINGEPVGPRANGPGPGAPGRGPGGGTRGGTRGRPGVIEGDYQDVTKENADLEHGARR